MRYHDLVSTDATEKRVTELYNLLKELNDYCIQLLNDENVQPDRLPTRKTYQYSLFVFAVSMVDGILSLSEKGQARAATLQARSLWETWLATRFIYCDRNQIWLHYLIANGEIDRLEMLADLLTGGIVTNDARHKRSVREAKKQVNYIGRRYKEFPVVPQVITSSRTFITKDPSAKGGYKLRTLSIKHKCMIVDHYNALYPSRHYTSIAGMLDQYEKVYWHYSNFAHVNPLELNNLFEKLPTGQWSVDISGGQKRDNLAIILKHSYLYHRELLGGFVSNLAQHNPQIPSSLPPLI
jgi:hypothetical protein